MPLLRHRQNRCLRRFHDAGATDAKSAQRLAEMGIGESLVFRYLRSRGVLREGEPGRYYVDAEAERRFRRRRRQFTLASFSIVVIVSVLAVFMLSR